MLTDTAERDAMPKVLGIAGDWHGNHPWIRFALEQLQRAGATHVMQLGDFGVFTIDDNRFVNDEAAARNLVVFVTLGNHENYDLLDAELVPSRRFEGWLQFEGMDAVQYAPRPHTWMWHGRSFMSMGGANSIDVNYRTPGESWWKQEQITDEQVRAASEVGQVDVVFAHDVFMSAQISTGGGTWTQAERVYANGSRRKLMPVAESARPVLWLHGHHHQWTSTTNNIGEATVQTQCLNMDGTAENLAVLDLATLELRQLAYAPSGA